MAKKAVVLLSGGVDSSTVQYAYEQGLIKKKPEVDSLFAPNTLEEFRI